jgi:hypothetical protein
MSLKAFHIFFIGCSALLAAGIGVWELRNFAGNGRFLDAVLGGASLLAGVGLVVYGIAFLRKMKHVGYL